MESTVRSAVELGYEVTMVKDATSDASVARADMKLEVIVIPVSDVGPARRNSTGGSGCGSTPNSPPVTTSA